MLSMNKGDAILRLLMEIKLELKEVKEQMERMETKIEKIEQQNRKKQITSQKETKINFSDTKDKRDWKYPAKLK
jgi:ribosome maturation factor RimP